MRPCYRLIYPSVKSLYVSGDRILLMWVLASKGMSDKYSVGISVQLFYFVFILGQIWIASSRFPLSNAKEMFVRDCRINKWTMPDILSIGCQSEQTKSIIHRLAYTYYGCAASCLFREKMARREVGDHLEEMDERLVTLLNEEKSLSYTSPSLS